MDGGGKMPMLQGSSWRDLPGNAVGMIAERLAILEYIRLCFVCKQWMHVVVSGQHLPRSPQAPWLILLGDHNEIGFLDILTGKIYKLRLNGAPISNSIDGAVGGLEGQRRHYQFPIIPTLSFKPLANALTKMTAPIFIPQDKVCNTLSFARGVDGSWTRVTQLVIGEGGKPEFEVASLDQGCIYAMGEGGSVDYWDISRAELILSAQRLHCASWPVTCLTFYNKFLVATTSRLLLVFLNKFEDDAELAENIPYYYRYITRPEFPGSLVLQLNNETYKWERIQSLGRDVDNSTAVLVDAASLPEPRLRKRWDYRFSSDQGFI